jgi:DHA2 family multidrug resistance protein
MLFVPLTTLTMSGISREEMGNATSIFNLMRNIGGSIGIATAATMLERNRQTYTNLLVPHVTPYGMGSQQMMNQLRSAMIARGADAVTAGQRAQAMLFGMVERQATMLSFLSLMKAFGIFFILLLPLVLITRAPRKDAHKPPPENNPAAVNPVEA